MPNQHTARRAFPQPNLNCPVVSPSATAERQKLVHAELYQLNESVGRIENLTKQLLDRLGIVSHQTSPSAAGEPKQEPQTDVSLANAINGATRRLHGASNLLEDQLARLEV